MKKSSFCFLFVLGVSAGVHFLLLKLLRIVSKRHGLSERKANLQNEQNEPTEMKTAASSDFINAYADLLFHRPAGQTRDELFLEGEEQDRRRDDRHQRPG